MIVKKHILGVLIVSFSAIILAFLGSLFVYQNAYAGKIYKNVAISGMDVSGKTKKQAETIITKKYNAISEKEVIFSAGGNQLSTKLSDTGFNFDINKATNSAYAVGRSHRFLTQLYASAKTSIYSVNIDVPIIIDNTKLNLLISEKLPELNIEAVDASISIDENGGIVITKEKDGLQIDSTNLVISLSNLLAANKNIGNIKLHTVTVSAKITAEQLINQKQDAEKIINSKIQLLYEDKLFYPSKKDLAKWVNFSNETDSVKVGLDENAIKSYLSIIAKDFEIARKDKKVNALDGNIIEEGQQGRYLDKNKAKDQIIKALGTGTGNIILVTYTEDPKEIKIFPAEGIVPGRFEGKYLDVDLTQQKMCQIESNVVLSCYTVSSGKASTPTPTGTRYVQSKNPKAWSAPYGLYMPWWQALGGGYGIHELPEWPGGHKEGESHLGTPVSHGCIRLGVGAAEAIYNWTEIGTPVYIHK